MKLFSKKGMIPGYVIAIIIAVVIISISVLLIFFQKDASYSLVDKIKDLIQIG